MSDLSEEMLNALRYIRGDENTGVIYGAAINAMSEELKGRGYVTGLPYNLTEKGHNALLRARVAELEEALPKAYYLGFMQSIDGYNSEYPFKHKSIDPTDMPSWVRQRDEDLATLNTADR